MKVTVTDPTGKTVDGVFLIEQTDRMILIWLDNGINGKYKGIDENNIERDGFKLTIGLECGAVLTIDEIPLGEDYHWHTWTSRYTTYLTIVSYEAATQPKGIFYERDLGPDETEYEDEEEDGE